MCVVRLLLVVLLCVSLLVCYLCLASSPEVALPVLYGKLFPSAAHGVNQSDYNSAVSASMGATRVETLVPRATLCRSPLLRGVCEPKGRRNKGPTVGLQLSRTSSLFSASTGADPFKVAYF